MALQNPDQLKELNKAKRKSADLSGIVAALQSDFTKAYLKTEWMFHPVRRWRFDFAIPARKIALEVQGGLYVQGGHVRGGYVEKEHEKRNEAAIMGWRILYCTPKEVKSGKALELIRRALAPTLS